MAVFHTQIVGAIREVSLYPIVTCPTALSTSPMCSDTHLQPLPDHLELRIFTRSVGVYSNLPANIIESDAHAASATMTHPPPISSSSSDFIHLLSGPINNFLLFSRQEHSKWLVDIAHDICDPLAQRGSLCIWSGQEWTTVAQTDPLTASVYLYAVSEGVVVSLSKRLAPMMENLKPPQAAMLIQWLILSMIAMDIAGSQVHSHHL